MLSKQANEYPKAFRALLLALVIGLTAFPWALGWLAPMEDALTAARANILSKAPTGEIVIVEIDAKSIERVDEWPWPRSNHAKLVERLDEAGAELVAFDVDFSSRSAKDGDAAFAEAIRKSGQVVLPIFVQQSTFNGGALVVSSPNEQFDKAWTGAVNVFPDADGLVREYPAAVVFGNAVHPSLASIVSDNSSDWKGQTFQPDWAIDLNQIPHVSFVDVVEGNIDPGFFAGKRVIVGGTAIELGDRYAIPRYGVVPGVAVQALAAESLLMDRAIVSTGPVLAALGLLLVLVLLGPKRKANIATYLLRCAAVFAIVIALPFAAQAVWPIEVKSAHWIVAIIACVLVQAVVETRNQLVLRERIDAETGLPNRLALQEFMQEESADGSLFIACVEHFDSIRDEVGIAVVNDAILLAAERIEGLTSMKVHRIAPNLLAWLHEGCGRRNAEDQALAMTQAFRQPIKTADGNIDFILTIGVDCSGSEAEAVMRMERAMSVIASTREIGRSSAVYRAEERSVRRQVSLMSDLRIAMEQGRVSVLFQPKHCTKTGKIRSAEALVRWIDESGKLVGPDEFIPLAEKTGTIQEVTRFVLDDVARQLASWKREELAMSIAVNISAVDLVDPEFAVAVAKILGEHGVEPSSLTLEITESAFIRSEHDAKQNLAALRQMGVRLSVDDYGTGQSTLKYLKELPVHELKIDRSFVDGICVNENDAILVKSTIDMAHELGLEVVVEGVEDENTFRRLASWNCDFVQGYFIGKPMDHQSLVSMAASGPAKLVA